MADGMVELVARAIGCIDADRCQFANSQFENQRKRMGSCAECLEAGQRAIAAMREPTEAMDAAARAECHRMSGVVDPVVHVWAAMIDAALGKPPA